MYKTMLVLLDGSELSEVVLEYAQELSGRMRIDLELLHVCDPHEAEQLPMRRANIEHMAESMCARAEEIRARSGGSHSRSVSGPTVRSWWETLQRRSLHASTTAI